MLSIALITTASLLALASVLMYRTRKLLSNHRMRQTWLRSICLLAVVTSFVLFFGVSSIFFKGISELGLYFLPPCFAALFLSLSILVRQTLRQLRHLYHHEGFGIYDSVTHVHNRYYLEQRLEAEIARSNRYNTPLALVAVEVKAFEKLNDEYGHQAGDMAATLVATTLKNRLRETDVVTRYNPGCFLLILPDTPERSVTTLVARLEEVLSGLVVIEGSESENPLRISVGVGTASCTLGTCGAMEMINKSLESIGTCIRSVPETRAVLSVKEELCEPS